jgi:hypothetical protein
MSIWQTKKFKEYYSGVRGNNFSEALNVLKQVRNRSQEANPVTLTGGKMLTWETKKFTK